MVQPKDLRLGNLLKDKKGRICRVETLESDLWECGIYAIDGGTTTSPLEYIPLTEEWLIKLGAIELVRMSDNYVRYNLDGIQLSISPEREFFIEYVHQIPIKYFHTLQNFYFATKQRDLEVK